MLSLRRRAAALPVLAVLAAGSALAVTAPSAHADNASTLTVVGTSDVYDSNLIQSVIKPGFEAANPGITLNYISKGTGAAIAVAEAGGASAMIVHAASLENQYVASGYSLEDYGRAIFWGDYVLLGPASDPAGVMKNAPSNIVAAFQRVAAAGAKGKANFVSRGGTPGTTVQEHAIWAKTSGVQTCVVSEGNGGGAVPSTTTGACPTSTTNPSWYQTTGLTQAPNVLNGDTCNYSGGGCYVFTDRGTYQYLKSQGSISTLGIVTRSSKVASANLNNLLVNSFHAYGVNPDKFAGNPNVSINVDGARKFLAYLTSPAAQADIGNYLSGSNDPPFIPDAAPLVTNSRFPLKPVDGGRPFTIAGKVSNVVPGTPALDGVPVSLNFTPLASGSQSVVATAKTDSFGKYSISYVPTAAGTYTISTDTIIKPEVPDLMPPFSDMLAPFTSARSGTVTVQASVTASIKGGVGSVSGTANVKPTDTVKPGSLDLYAGTNGEELQYISSIEVPVGTAKLQFKYSLPPGNFQVQLHYVNSSVVLEGTSSIGSVTVN